MSIRAGFTSALPIAIFWTMLTGPWTLMLRAQPQTLPLAPPFVLTPAEEKNLNQLLADWEKADTSIKTFKCTFTRWEYDPANTGGNPNQATTESYGEIKYAAPDKGMFKAEDIHDYVLNPKTNKFEKQKAERIEWWTCDGNSMFEVTVRNNGEKVEKLVMETLLPPEMRGKAITEGPLPFVFGARAATLKSRYYMHIVTPEASAKNEVWLEAFPKQQTDAANFSRVMIILDKASMQPSANPGASAQNNSRSVIMLKDVSINNPLDTVQNFINNFARPNPIGYKHVLNQNLVPPSTTTKLPDSKAVDSSQASSGKPAAR